MSNRSSFQLTRSRGAWQWEPLTSTGDLLFQLTRSRGAWPDNRYSVWTITLISTHTLTWSVTDCKHLKGCLERFQLTRSRGAWRICWSQTKDGQNFNSHAHVERDVTLIFEISAKSISTHTLTWSVTVCEQEVKGYFKDFNSHAHVERDNRATWNYLHMVNFNSHAHVERDCNVATLKILFVISTHTLTWSVTVWYIWIACQLYISTHTLTWSVTYNYGEMEHFFKFQLTRSRGAWRI